MIRYVYGQYLMYSSGQILLLTDSGVGFRVTVPDTSPLLYAKEGDKIGVFTHMHVKEDEMLLYGFDSMEALVLFEDLITVNGVGPKAAMSIMSLGTPAQIKSYIAAKDASYISCAQGVGKKTAERIILELSEKISTFVLENAALPNYKNSVGAVLSSEKAEAILALTALGYSKNEAETAVASVEEDGLTVEEYVKKSLKYLL